MQTARLRATFFALLALVLGSGDLSHGAQGPFGISASVTHSQNLNDYQDETMSRTNDYAVVPRYKWASITSLLILTYSQDLRHPERNDLGDIALKTLFNSHDFSKVQLSPSLTFVSPQSKYSRENLNLEGALSAKLEAAIQKKLLIPGLSLAAAIGAGRSFHRYETNISGRANIQHTSPQTLSASYDYKSVSISAEFHHINRWSYSGQMTEAFEHAEEISYSPANFIAIALGHTNAGPMLKVNGIDSNLKLIDDNNSLVYARVGIQY